MTAEVDIGPGSADDLTVLVAVLGERHWFTDRLAQQQRGGGVLLVAWLEGCPVGEVFLDCEPATEPEVRRHLPGGAPARPPGGPGAVLGGAALAPL